MARVSLRDDSCWGGLSQGVGVGLDDDSCRPAPVPPGEEQPNILPRITVRDRVSQGMDALGNPTWAWADRVVDAPTTMWVQREERDDRAGVTRVRARVGFLYPTDVPALRETARAKTDDGHQWTVSEIERWPGRVEMTMERVDDGP